ncbi:Holliday junction branch migration protein RuvA [Selenomonas sp. oral taxon 136]|uniref:Holliday junction branch migration protein RuvA n=1 Tax=Selenomonas sp. oral taxon 136 TaxID=713030 RepID=UPI000767FA1D|nr:Holliday junction branch migration protein RuvA [Selenomonas sp. oral taxon 136]AME04616.1 Holliday junction ATP-dependent DNA helicase RuvA [Selenomonas sp. oral taxon 136]
MIGFLKGKATHITSDYCLLDVHDVGYRVFISNQTRAHISPSAEVMLYIHTNVREDAILLYGFFSQEEYDLFLHLIGISGIGPKVAQGILSSATVNDFYRMVQQKDVKGITKLPGIGKKTAERILLELKDKLSDVSVADLPEGDNNVGTKAENSMIAEATEALLTLGFQDSEIQRVFRQRHSCQNTEELIRYALTELQRL